MTTGVLQPVVHGTEPDGDPVVEIRTAKLDLKQRASANTPVDLEPGHYVVTAVLPDGSKPTQSVLVKEGETSEVVLATLPGRRTPDQIRASVERETVSFSPGSLFSWLPGVGKPKLYTRLELLGRGPAVDAPAGALPRVFSSTEAGDVTHVNLAVEPPPALSIAQFGAGREVPTNVVLPVHSEAHLADCTLRVDLDREGDVDPVALPTGSPVIDLIAGYMQTGQVEAAAEVAIHAEDLLRGKVMNPIAAALAGYALLRLGEMKRLHDWPTNLANWFPWLPDGPVIAGEQAARVGDEEAAAEWFAATLDRGYPMFSDGFSLLASRLRGYLHSDHPPQPILDREDEARRLVRMTPFVDFTQLVLTFQGRDVDDPAGSQKPLPRWPRLSPWKALKHA